MMIVTSDEIPGKKIESTLGAVRGSSVRARHIGKDIVAFFKNIVGGEVEEYTKLLAESREQAMDRMIAQATTLGADAVVCVRFASSQIAPGVAEVMIYGTAVRLAS